METLIRFENWSGWNWSNSKVISVSSPVQGNGWETFDACHALLREQGIPSRRAETPYVGHVGIEVPAAFGYRAGIVLLG